MDGSAMDGGAAEPVAEATVRDDAATTIQAMERRRQAMRMKKRAELKARWGLRSQSGATARHKKADEERAGGVSSLEELNAANTGIGPSALQLLATAMPARLTALNLRDNDFGTPAVYRVKTNSTTGQPKGILNANKGGATGHTGMMKITKGVVIIDQTGRAYRVQSTSARAQTNRGAMRRSTPFLGCDCIASPLMSTRSTECLCLFATCLTFIKQAHLSKTLVMR